MDSNFTSLLLLLRRKWCVCGRVVGEADTLFRAVVRIGEGAIEAAVLGRRRATGEGGNASLPSAEVGNPASATASCMFENLFN